MSVMENIVLITLDGVRTQEMFNGLDLEVLRYTLSTKSPEIKLEHSDTYKKYWAATTDERRRRLLPFFWNDLLKNSGCVLGNRERGSVGQLTNKFRVSYPGYAEILTGHAYDEDITAHDNKRIPHITICEFIKHKLQLDKMKVAAFASWQTFSRIVEQQIGTVTCNAGLCPYSHPEPFIQQLSQLQFDTVMPFSDLRHDIYTFKFALAHMKTYKPKFLYVGFGETDDWAHEKRYDLVLDALHRCDNYIQQIWEYIQNDEYYKNKTAMIITTDHGRGEHATDWHDHDENIEGSQYVWIACAGPHLTKRGDLIPQHDPPTFNAWDCTHRTRSEYDFYSNQIAATILRLLGMDPKDYSTNIGAPIVHFL